MAEYAISFARSARKQLQVLDRALALRIIGRIGRAAPTGCVMVLGSVRFERVVEALMLVGERLRREINPVLMTPQGFRAQLEARDRFVSRVAREPKLFIKGHADDLGEPARDRPIKGASR